jgi:hypothetical protein
MSNKHLHLLRSLFQDSVSANIHWREIESLLQHLGATIEPLHGARFRILLNRHEYFLHHPHQGNVFSRQDIKHLREFLTHAGVSPSSYEMQREAERKANG